MQSKGFVSVCGGSFRSNKKNSLCFIKYAEDILNGTEVGYSQTASSGTGDRSRN